MSNCKRCGRPVQLAVEQQEPASGEQLCSQCARSVAQQSDPTEPLNLNPHDPAAAQAPDDLYNRIEGQPLPPDDSAPPELTRNHSSPVDSRYSARDKSAARSDRE